MAGTEVVERRQEALLAVFGDDPLHMRDIDHALVFGKLEHDLIVREANAARGLERRTDASGWLVDNVGHEVDGQPGLGILEQLTGKLDGLHTAGLVELVTVCLVHLPEDPARSLSLRAPHQGLVAPDPVLAEINDGLKGHGEVERQ
ncbi:hypothetical protein OFEAOIEE_LOCUS4755 [Methylorubrum extorquens]